MAAKRAQCHRGYCARLAVGSGTGLCDRAQSIFCRIRIAILQREPSFAALRQVGVHSFSIAAVILRIQPRCARVAACEDYTV